MVAFNPLTGTQGGSDFPASDRRVINLMELLGALVHCGGFRLDGL